MDTDARASGRRATRSAPQAPVVFRSDGVHVGERFEAYARDRAGRRLGRRAGGLQKATIRLVDLNGPRGGVDVECRIELALRGANSLFVSKRSPRPRAAFDQALDAARSALDRVVRGRARPAREQAGADREVGPEAQTTAEALGGGSRESLIGRREGRGRESLLRAADRPEKRRRDVPVDTSRPGRSATDRRAGAGSTARRNTKLHAPKAAVMLEDSAQDRPSRKSTRRSAGRNRPDNPLYLSRRRGLGRR